MKYRAHFPFMPDMGSYSPVIVTESRYESKEEQALWDLNSARRHDGLTERKALPKGMRFVPTPEQTDDIHSFA